MSCQSKNVLEKRLLKAENICRTILFNSWLDRICIEIGLPENRTLQCSQLAALSEAIKSRAVLSVCYEKKNANNKKLNKQTVLQLSHGN